MDSDVVVVLKGLTQQGNSLHRQVRRVERVDPEVRTPACVCRPPDEPHAFCDHSVMTGTGSEGTHFGRVGVGEECNIDVIKLTETYELLLAGQKLDLA